MLSLDSVSLQDKKQYNEDLLLAASIHHFKGRHKTLKTSQAHAATFKKGQRLCILKTKEIAECQLPPYSAA